MFKLMRFFSIASALTIALAMIAVSTVVTNVTTKQLIHEREAANVTLTQAFSNSIWNEFRNHVATAAPLSGDMLRALPETERLSSELRKLMDGLTVIKVKVYAPNGNTVFSTEPSQMGGDKKDNPGFRAAMHGTVASEISHRDGFSAFDQEITNIDVISSYIPIRGKSGKVEGVFEIYDNITDTLGDVRYRRYAVIATVCSLFIALYMILQIIVGHAAKVMGRQHQEMIAAKSELESANEELAEEMAQRESAQKELQQTYEQLVERTGELQQAQDSLVQKERLATLGQLTATVSHELRNPMGAIRTSLFLAKQKTEGKGLGVERALDRAERNIVRCDTIIAELLDFARDTAPNLELTEADVWLRQTVKEQDLPEGVELALELGAEGVPLAFDKERLRRAVINVFDNGAQAMADNPPERPRKLTVSTRAGEATFEMIFKDRGAGMDAETLSKIFEPLFSTKSFGVGLGLPTVKKIIEGHGGEIVYDSVPGEGTTVTIRLPLKSARKEAA